MSEMRKYMDITSGSNCQYLQEGILDRIRNRIFKSSPVSREDEIKREVDQRVKAKADGIYDRYIRDFTEAGVAQSVENTIVWLHRFSLSPATIRAAFAAIGISVGDLPERLSGYDDVEELTAAGGADGDPTTGGLDGAPQGGDAGEEEMDSSDEDMTGQSSDVEPDGHYPVYDADGNGLHLGDEVSVLIGSPHLTTEDPNKKTAAVGKLNHIDKSRSGVVMVELSDRVIRLTFDQIDAGMLHKGRWSKADMVKWIRDNHRNLGESWSMLILETKLANMSRPSGPSLDRLVEGLVNFARLVESPDTAIISKGKLLMLFEIILYLELAKRKGFTTTEVTPHTVRDEYRDEIIQDAFREVLTHAKELQRERADLPDSREEMNATLMAVKPVLNDALSARVDALVERVRKSRRMDYYILLDAALMMLPGLVKKQYGVAEAFLDGLLDKLK